MESPENILVLALVRDLMFSGRIIAEARAANVGLKVVRDPASLLDFSQSPAKLLLVDLNQDGAIEAASLWRQAGARTTVGFVSHVDADAIARAKAAGIDQILARSGFVQILPNLLRAQIV